MQSQRHPGSKTLLVSFAREHLRTAFPKFSMSCTCNSSTLSGSENLSHCAFLPASLPESHTRTLHLFQKCLTAPDPCSLGKIIIFLFHSLKHVFSSALIRIMIHKHLLSTYYVPLSLLQTHIWWIIGFFSKALKGRFYSRHLANKDKRLRDQVTCLI